MGEISRPYQGNALELRPTIEMFEIEIFARRPGEVGVNVEVSDEAHGHCLLATLHRRRELSPPGGMWYEAGPVRQSGRRNPA